jgi:hypothetical protein
LPDKNVAEQSRSHDASRRVEEASRERSDTSQGKTPERRMARVGHTHLAWLSGSRLEHGYLRPAETHVQIRQPQNLPRFNFHVTRPPYYSSTAYAMLRI